MRSIKTLTPAMGLMLAFGATPAVHADVIVKWDGRTNDVTPNSTQEVTQLNTFTTASGYQSPTQGPDYYPNAGPDDDPNFYAAKSIDSATNSFGIFNGGNNDLLARYEIADGNPGTYHAMYAWDFNADLTSFHSTAANDWDSAEGHLRWIFQEKGGDWYATNFQFNMNGGSFNTLADAPNVAWVPFTPHVNGVVTIGDTSSGTLGANLDLEGVPFVGFYTEFTTDVDSGPDPGSGVYMTSFSVEGTPGVDPPLTGDLDGDGFVGIGDLNLVLGNWNLNVPPGNPLADPSGDLFVGIDDLNEVLGNWNAGTPPAAGAVPEPATLSLLALGGLAMMRRR